MFATEFEKRRGGRTDIELGKLLGVHRATVAKWKSGKTIPHGFMSKSVLDRMERTMKSKA